MSNIVQTCIHNPVEKKLEMFLLGCNAFKLRKRILMQIMDQAIILSKSKPLKKQTQSFDSGSAIQGLSITYILSESHAALHTSPEHSYLSLEISTCGNVAHPFKSVGYIIEQTGPTAGNICYSKVGMDLMEKTRHPKSLRAFINKYSGQFDRNKFTFKGFACEPGDYSIYFWDPKSITENEVRKHLDLTKKQFRNYVPL